MGDLCREMHLFGTTKDPPLESLPACSMIGSHVEPGPRMHDGHHITGPRSASPLTVAVMGDLVSLYRCKRCGIRMFEARTRDHLRTHGIDGNGSTLAHFERGPKDTFPTPGGQPPTYGRVPKNSGGRRKGKDSSTPPDDGIETTEEEPVVSLSELVES